MDKKKLSAKLAKLLQRQRAGERMTKRLQKHIDSLYHLLKTGKKVCKYCSEELDWWDFYSILSAFDGLSADCRSCRSSIGSENYYKRRYGL